MKEPTAVPKRHMLNIIVRIKKKFCLFPLSIVGNCSRSSKGLWIEYFSTLWGSPFPVSFSREGTTGKKVRSINFFVEEGVRELRSQTAPVPVRWFNQSSEDGKIVGQSKAS